MNRKFCEKCTRHSFANDVDIIELCPKHRMVDELIAACRLVLEFYYVGSDQISPPVRDAIEAALAKAEPKERGE